MAADYSPMLGSILSAAASRLIVEKRPLDRVELVHGQVPTYDGGCDGQLYLQVRQVYPTAGRNAPFPRIDADQAGAGGVCAIHGLAIKYALGVVRCVSVFSDEEGEPPEPGDVSDSTALILMDMSDLLDVLMCSVPEIPGVLKTKLDNWSPLSSEGGRAGGEWLAYVMVNPCLCQKATIQ